ncbi:MAG: hypothetical protein WKG00_13320 [Polyangiaceae bacterium]
MTASPVVLMAAVPSPPPSHVAPRRSLRVLGATFAAGAVLALLPALLLRGFTVDDALIPARYAANLAHGAGYRFNAQGPVTDGVTPLGWAHLLVPFAGNGPVGAFAAAKHLGLVAWVLAAGALALAVGCAGARRRRFLALGLLPVSAPLAAWSVAGLETGVVAAMVALGLAARPPQAAPRAVFRLAAGWRPELVRSPWSPLRQRRRRPSRRRLPSTATATTMATATGALTRDGAAEGTHVGQRPARVELVLRVALAVRVPGRGRDAQAGVRWRHRCLRWPRCRTRSSAPLRAGVLPAHGPAGHRRAARMAAARGFARALVVAVGAHYVAIVLAGGDWMPPRASPFRFCLPWSWRPPTCSRSATRAPAPRATPWRSPASSSR